jgi:uncharacterized protein (DUF58 family)
MENLLDSFDLLKAAPAVIMVLSAIPLLVLARQLRVYPNRLLPLLLLVPTACTLGLLAADGMLLMVVVLDIAILVVAVADTLTLPNLRQLSGEREILRVASLQKPHSVTLVITNSSSRTLLATVRDDVPQQFLSDPQEFELTIGPLSRATMSYELHAQRRGKFEMEEIHVRVRSRLGFWRRYHSLPVRSEIHVYPDMKQLSEYALLARTNRLSLMGVRRTRKIGQDNEFERLRDYTPDDNYKFIDWRSTARRSKLTVKDFQANQSQRIVFLMDCGRMMTNSAAGISLLDHSLNAMLMLSFVALDQGDAVGLVCFSDRIHTYVPPRSGMNQMNQLLHASFDRFPQLVESRYDNAFLHLATNCKKRSLVVLISNVIDEVNSLQIQQYMGSITGRHLPLTVLLRDRSLFEAAEHPAALAAVDDTMFAAAAAAEILTWRHQVLTDLEHRGIMALDVFPEDMTAPLVNSYLEIKARHLL